MGTTTSMKVVDGKCDFHVRVVVAIHDIQWLCDVINKDAVGYRSSATTRKAGCGNQRSECIEGNGGSKETEFENEDYVYTHSLP
ncbi:unnamed protein product [Lupinus luteus]|uniref:Uncharacterized protein n=1 Tax=Lupinus luteus TaxID=3873 RepID=A0AAV1XU97_LUPLU